jgi:hypothetical protein
MASVSRCLILEVCAAVAGAAWRIDRLNWSSAHVLRARLPDQLLQPASPPPRLLSQGTQLLCR